MIRFFRSPQPAALFVIPFISILLWFSGWSDLEVYEGTKLSPLWNLTVPVFLLFPSWLRMLLMSGVVSASAIYFNLILNRYEVLYRNSYLPSFFYTLLSAALPAFVAVHPVHFINLILLFLLNELFQSYRQPKPVASLFNTGFLAALCCLLYLPLFPLLLFCILALPVLRSFNVRESLVLCIGILVPFYLLSAWWFPERLKEEVNWISRYVSQYRLNWDLTVTRPVQSFGVLLLLIFIFAAIRLRQHYYKNVIRTRLYQQTIILLLFFLSITLLFSPAIQLFSFLLLTVPFTVFCTYYFVSGKKRLWFYELLLLLLIAVVFWNRIPLEKFLA